MIDIIIGAIIIILTFTALCLPLKIFYNLLRYKKASLGLIFNRLDESITVFKIYAIAGFIFSIGRLLDLLNIVSASSAVDDLATVLNFTTVIVLIYAFYKLLNIMRIEDQTV